jgi:hypothetical protein
VHTDDLLRIKLKDAGNLAIEQQHVPLAIFDEEARGHVVYNRLQQTLLVLALLVLVARFSEFLFKFRYPLAKPGVLSLQRFIGHRHLSLSYDGIADVPEWCSKKAEERSERKGACKEMGNSLLVSSYLHRKKALIRLWYQ